MDYSAAPRPQSGAQELAHDSLAYDTSTCHGLLDSVPAKARGRVSHAKAIAAITLGNGLEFFDFTIYSFFATIIGNGDGEGGCMVHNPGYDFNDDCLATGAAYWVRLTESFLA